MLLSLRLTDWFSTFQCFLSLFYLHTTDIIVLIEYSSFVESSFIFLTVLGMLYLRWKKPNLDRPIRVHIILPIIFLLICGFLVVVPCFVRPKELGVGILITLTGVPFYMIFIRWQPKCLNCVSTRLTRAVQKTFMSLKEDWLNRTLAFQIHTQSLHNSMTDNQN